MPDLVKPNVHELAELTGRVRGHSATSSTPPRSGTVVPAPSWPVSGDGAVLVDDDGALWGHAPVDRIVVPSARVTQCWPGISAVAIGPMHWRPRGGRRRRSARGTCSRRAHRVSVTVTDAPTRNVHCTTHPRTVRASREPDDAGRGDPRSRGLPAGTRRGAGSRPGEALVRCRPSESRQRPQVLPRSPHVLGHGPVRPTSAYSPHPGTRFVSEIVAIDDLGRERWG
jgi:hypothetical protein